MIVSPTFLALLSLVIGLFGFVLGWFTPRPWKDR